MSEKRLPRKSASSRQAADTFTPLELELMKVLWALGSGTVLAVQEALPGAKLAYTTVQTMLNVLEAKGKVNRVLKDRAYVYSPCVSRVDAISATMRDLIDRMFEGSAESLVMGLLETKQISAQKLRDLHRKLEEQP
jgi:BlaI family transcriptional regulator, penicillinase repressor